MKAAHRQIRIRELIEEREFVDLETLCRELGTSESTVRRDLDHLERQHVLKRVHGGALAVQPRGHLLDYDWQQRRQNKERCTEEHETGQVSIALCHDTASLKKRRLGDERSNVKHQRARATASRVTVEAPLRALRCMR